MKKRPRISKIGKAIKQELGHLKQNLVSIDDLITCSSYFLAAGRHNYHLSPVKDSPSSIACVTTPTTREQTSRLRA